MTWFKIDDKSSFHPKILAVGNEVWGAVCRAGAWSSSQLTDGKIPWAIATKIAPKSVWKKAFFSQLCEPTDDPKFFQLHDYLDWNQSREQVLQLRALRSEAGRAGGKQKAKQVLKQVLPPIQANGLASAKHSPIPIPIQEKKEAEEKKDSSRLPGLDILETEIRRHELFAALDAHAIAKSQAERLLTAPQKPEWLVVAIRQCAEKNVGQGLNARALQSVLVGFMHKAKRPEPLPPTHKPAQIDSEEDEAIRIADAAKRLADRNASDAIRLANEAKAKGAKP